MLDPNRSTVGAAISWKRITLLMLLALGLIVVIGVVYTLMQPS